LELDHHGSSNLQQYQQTSQSARSPICNQKLLIHEEIFQREVAGAVSEQ
jgi:hypothetical protein